MKIPLKTAAVLLMAGSMLHAQHYTVTLDEAIETALRNNNAVKISHTDIAIARAQYKQAMSANYPSIDLKASAMRADEDLTFDLQGHATTSGTVVAQQLMMAGGVVDTAQILSGTSPSAVTGTAAAQALIASGAATDQVLPFSGKVTVAGRDVASARLNLLYPIYTGGKISALIDQAELGTLISRENERRTCSEVVYDVKTYYYGAMLLRKVKQLVGDTKERMGFTRDLTEEMYKGGSMNVKKTDYLRSKLSVDLIASMYEEVAIKEKLALSALANAMGLSWDDSVETAQAAFGEPLMGDNMQELVDKALRFNPQMATMRLARKVEDARIKESKSGFLPAVAFTASVQTLYNNYDYGLINDDNKNSWTIGVGLEWNLFNGMRTRAETEQRRLEKRKREEQAVMLEEGIALQMKHALLGIESSYRRYHTLSVAAETAAESRDLNTRAYQEDMVETKDVIEAQIMESITKANLFHAMHDYAMARATADFLAGSALEKAQE